MTNTEVFNYLGITKFIEAGYKGQGVKVATRESSSAKHGGNIMDILKQVAENAEFFDKVDYTNPGSFQPDVYTTSWFLSSDGYERNKRAIKRMYDNGAFITCAVGNGDLNAFSENDCVAPIGAVVLDKNGEVLRATYSSKTNLLKFMSFSNIYSSTGQKLTGTSFSAPLFAGMIAILQSYFLQKINRKLTNEELWSFIKAHTTDLGDKGKDILFGFGLFILPDPNEIDLAPYQSSSVIEIVSEKIEKKDEVEEIKEEVALIDCSCEKCSILKRIINKLLRIFGKS